MEAKIIHYETPKEDIIDFVKPIDEKQCKKLINILNNKINSKGLKIMKYVFKEIKFFHNYLKENQEIINIKFDILYINLSSLFYLCLLMEDNTIYINYSYKRDIIEHFNNLHKIYNKNEIINIIIAKHIKALTYNYRGLEDFDEYLDEEKIKEIEVENNNIIRNNIQFLNDIGLNWNENDIYEKKIDELYIDIIIAVFNNNLFEDYEYMHELFEQLDFEFIDLTEIMRNKLLNYLDGKNKNLLIDKNFLIEEKNINYYYFILKYLLKEPSTIAQFPFLLSTRNQLIDLIKRGKAKIKISHLDKGIQMRYKYFFKTLLGSVFFEQNLTNIFEISEKKNIKSTKNYENKIKNNFKNERENENDNNKKESRNDKIKIDKKIFEEYIKKSSYPYWKEKDFIYFTEFKYPYEKMLFIYNISFDIRTKTILNVIDGNDISIL